MDLIQPQNHGLNYNITFQIYFEIIDDNFRWNYLFFTEEHTNKWKLRCVADHNNDFELSVTQWYSC